jgi:DNA-binding LacI/PurR family transcriptional regulator
MNESSRAKRPSQRVTADEVARVLGVSQSTISRAFSTSASISEEMRSRVMATAAELGYQPNVLARSLMTRRTDIIAIVLPNLTDPFYAVVLDELTQRLQPRGCQTLLFVPAPGQEIDEILPMLLQYQVDGIIITSATVSSAMARACAKRETPVVLLNRYVPGLEIHAVSCDNVAGGRQIADLLLRQNHCRPAFVAGQLGASTSADRQSGFVGRFEESGIECLIEQGGDHTYQAGFDAALRLMRRPDRPDAIFFASDIMAFGGIDALRRNSFSVPDDVSVAGFNGVPISGWDAYDLTTIRHPFSQMADAALELLGFGDAEIMPSPTTRLIHGDLIVRGSTKPRSLRLKSA